MSETLAFRVRALDETTSTNDEVKRAIEAGEAEGLVVRALKQTGGYGRQGRTWTSPVGGLYFSLLLRPHVSPAQLPTLSLVTGLAVRRALAALAREAADVIKVKWPNDVVFVDGSSSERGFLKLCGISCEAHAGGVCVGVGVNVLPPAERPQLGGKNHPAYLADLAPQIAGVPMRPALDTVFEALVDEFAPLYRRWTAEGFASFMEEFDCSSALTGSDVNLLDRESRVLAAGRVVRVDEQGRLVLRHSDGTEVAFASGEAHLA